jgi:hypothetical protein
MVPDSIKTYQYTVRIAITQDTTITQDWWIGQDTVLVIKDNITIRFDSLAGLIINGGTLVVGRPTHTGYPGYYTNRSQHDDCDCGTGPWFTCSPGHTDWEGIHIKAGSTVYLYGADFTHACLPIKIEGDPSPSLNWCNDPPPQTKPDEFVWIECCSFRLPVDRNHIRSPYPHAAIYLHGKQASHTILTRISIYGDDGSRLSRGIIIEGDSVFGPVRGPYVTSVYIQDVLGNL